ncbi:MAG: hypothetical protein MJ010_04250 [Paludibacteraceae bacterium]|nr:hypothetical protein [Paludibacteraceae bacterium]
MAEPIKFYKGEETGIVHESYKERETSLFKDQYDKALSEINAYLEEVDNWSRNHTVVNEFDINNIFAFIGDRGSGKSSCMESVINMLFSAERYNFQEKFPKISQTKFLRFSKIDPTLFNRKTNLLEVTIGALYSSYVDGCRNDRIKTSDELKPELANAFQELRLSIQCLSDDNLLNSGLNSISQLSDLATVAKVNNRFADLINNYLKFFNKDVIVIGIDDIDLQSDYAFQMVEHLRKYFIQSNVIVLISFKMEQLLSVIELEQTRKYMPLYDTEAITSDAIYDMAIKCLLKLIPSHHRIFLPQVRAYVNENIEYYRDRIDLEPKTKATPIKYAITELIYQKCRFLFYHTKGEVSPIVPQNLRELRHLYAMLVEMEDYDNNNPNYGNKLQFLQYFYNTWVEMNIVASDYKIIQNILGISDVASINKGVIKQLNIKYSGLLNGMYEEVLTEKNSSYNISVADVFTIVDYLKRRVSSRNDKMLLFFIETYYSIKLYEYYDELTDKIGIGGVQITDNEETLDERQHKVKESIVKREVVDGISNYEILVGGKFINTDEYQMLPKEAQTETSRARRLIDLEKLSEVAEQLLNGDCSSGFTIQTIEIFALCISRVVDSVKAGNVNYRTGNALYYKDEGGEDVTKQYKYAEFDLGAFFFNVVNIKRAYDRVHPELFEFSKTNGTHSLYKALLRTSKDLRNFVRYTEEHALLSCAAIRNFEILSDFVSFMQYDRMHWQGSSSNLQNILAFFQKVAEYYIGFYSYTLEDGIEEPDHIEFSYIKCIVDVFLELKERNSDFGEKAFDSIFVIKEEVNELSSFDVQQILQLFGRYPIQIKTLRDRVSKRCKPVFDNNAEAKEDWPFFLKKYGNLNDKVDKFRTEEILMKFKSIHALK